MAWGLHTRHKQQARVAGHEPAPAQPWQACHMPTPKLMHFIPCPPSHLLPVIRQLVGGHVPAQVGVLAAQALPQGANLRLNLVAPALREGWVADCVSTSAGARGKQGEDAEKWPAGMVKSYLPALLLSPSSWPHLERVVVHLLHQRHLAPVRAVHAHVQVEGHQRLHAHLRRRESRAAAKETVG